MAHKRSVRLHAEYKPMLSMLNIVLDLSECFGDGMSEAETEPCFVDVEEDTISLRWTRSRAVFHLKNLLLSPPTCRGLRWCSPAELHLSVQARHKQDTGGTVHTENGVIQHEVEEERSMNNQDMVVNRIKECQHRCYCAGCGRPVFSPNSVFQRVLPLPTENWSDFADIWFCHNHSHGAPEPGTEPHQSADASATQPDATPTQPGVQTTQSGAKLTQLGAKPTQQDASAPAAAGQSSQPQPSPEGDFQKPKYLSPRAGDCLVSSLYLLVRSSQVCASTVGITPHTQRLVCTRCGNFIGFVKKKDPGSGEGEDVFKIYLHSIKFTSPETPPPSTPDNSGLSLAPLQNDSIASSLVEDFLCRLLKDQSRQFTSFRFIVQSSHEEHSDSLPIVLLVWLLDQNLQVFSSRCPLASQEEVPVIRVLKLLYKASFLSCKDIKKSSVSGDGVFKMWERDNTVHPIDLPYPLCKQLLSLLIKSTTQLPASQRSLNTFHVGYLHYRPVAQVTG